MEKIKLYDLMYNINEKKIKSWITSIDEINKNYNSYDVQTINKSKMRSATDYAIACGVFSTKSEFDKAYNGKQAAMYYIYNAKATKKNFRYIYFIIDRIGMWCVTEKHFGVGVKPNILLNAEAMSVINSNRKTKGMFNISKIKNDEGKVLFHSLDFGEYPKDRVVDCENIEAIFQNGKLQKTGIKYPAYTTDDGEMIFGEEYIFENQKYVRLKTYTSNIAHCKTVYENGDDFANSKEYQWFKVQPQRFIIDNWEDLPKGVNPRGTGKDKIIKLEREEVIGACSVKDLNNWLKSYDNSAFSSEINIKYELPQLSDNTPIELEENEDDIELLY